MGVVNIGWGTIISGTHGQFAERKAAIKKIYQKYGMGTWTIQDVHKIWTKRERTLINMNYLKNRNMIEESGWAPGGKIHLWKLKFSLILFITED